MSSADRQRWDAKYSGKSVAGELMPNGWLLKHIESLPRGRALDLATGLGHSAIELARRGWEVTAIDISPMGLQIAAESARRWGITVQWIAADLDVYPLPRDHFDLVTCFYYLDREELPLRVVQSLRPGGMLVFETYTLDQLRVPGNHLTNPDHTLRPGELLTMFSELRVQHYRDEVLPDRAVASLLAQKVASGSASIRDSVSGAG
ncbi:MAG: class I SAM-dependent methyltransferase [Planctomycetes bacterium]|nr:class I SAM-dependent methyltransferase [Planctomycetota bacterium]